MTPIDDTTQFIPAGGGGLSLNGGSGSIPPGTVLSHTYRVENFLAKGGMGEVYKVQHVELGTWHAIKVIQDEFASNEKVMDLFRREAGVLRGLRHDAVVGYDGLMRDEQGRIYLAMEFVEGSPLGSLLKYGPLSVEDVQILRGRIGAGLAAAHKSGVVHRDMSPDNIILPDDRPENAKIIDFGIAKLSDPDQATVLGDDFAGKYSYAAPEQLGLYGGHVDHRSDIYSFGLVLAAAATGRALDMGSNPMQILEARKSLPDLSDVPEALVDVLAKMLQPDPEERLQSLDDAGGAPAPTPRPAARKAAPQPEKKSGGGKLVMGVVGLAAVAAVGIGAAVVLTGDDAPVEDGGTDVALVDPPSTPTDVSGGSTSVDGSASAPSAPDITTPPEIGDGGSPSIPDTGSPSIPDSGATQPIGLGGDTTGGAAPDAPSGGVDMANVTPPADFTTPGVPNDTGALPSGGGAPTVPGGVGTPDAPTVPDQPDAGQQIASLNPTADLSDRDKQIDQALRDVQCGFVNARYAELGGPVVLKGHLPDATEKRILTATLSELPGVTSIDAKALQTLGSPRCGLIEMLDASTLSRSAEQKAQPIAMGRHAQVGQLSFRGGDRLRLDLTAPPFAAHYYVDFYDSDGNVIHLLPSPVAPNNQLRPNESVVIGGTDRYTISPPYGVDLVVAIGASTPLFTEQRPELENAAQYLKALKNALNKEGASTIFQGEYSYVFVETSP